VSNFVVGDIHGNFQLLDGAIKSIIKRKKSNDKIVFLGDIIDGGMDSRKCIESIIELKNQFGNEIVCIKGNHEEWFLETKLNYAKHSWILSMEGLKTIESYSKNAADIIKKEMKIKGPSIIMDNFSLPYNVFFDIVPSSHIELIESMVDYYEDEQCICVHAGISAKNERIEDMDTKKMKWGFEGFPEQYKKSKTVIYGHWSSKAKSENGKIIPYKVNKTICIDTQKYGILSVFVVPENMLISISKSNK